jgi:hypothetical protein
MTDPDLISLYKEYLAAFNTHDLSKTLSFLAPNCKLSVLGGPTKVNTPEESQSAYSNDWVGRTKPVVLQEIKLIEKDGMVGVWTDLYDEQNRKQINIDYWYVQQDDGSWKHIWHDITHVDRTALPKT